MPDTLSTLHARLAKLGLPDRKLTQALAIVTEAYTLGRRDGREFEREYAEQEERWNRYHGSTSEWSV